ncbi:hypothetical protein KJ966_19590 [bacterium]|nr:hypothetical protein [bacterium]
MKSWQGFGSTVILCFDNLKEKLRQLLNMSIKEILKQKLADLDQKVKARLAVHDMEPKLKKKWEIRQNFQEVGKDIDENIDLIERMKTKVEDMEK